MKYLVLLIMIGCQNNYNKKNNNEVYIDNYEPPTRGDLILKKDINALIVLFTENINNDKPVYLLLPEALYIAETTKDPEAYNLIYTCTLSKYSSIEQIDKNHLICFDKISEEDKGFVLKYLEKGFNQNDAVCKAKYTKIKNRVKEKKQIGF